MAHQDLAWAVWQARRHMALRSLGRSDPVWYDEAGLARPDKLGIGVSCLGRRPVAR